MENQRKEPITTIAVNKSVIVELDKYLDKVKMSRKEFVEKAAYYFISTGLDINDNVSVLSPMQEMMAEIAEKQEKRDQVIFTILQNIQSLQPLQALAPAVQKALPEIQKETTAATEAKLAYKRAKKALQNLCKNNKYSVRISRIKNILDEYFDL